MKPLRLLLFFVLLGVAAAFPYGPLFPWSPWKPGFQHLATRRGDVYFATRTLPQAYRDLDRHIDEAEVFHGYTASQRITVVLCRDWSQFQRFLPHLRSHGLGGVTLATGNVIYITPKLNERGLDHAEYLRHELSHAVLHQNQSIRAAYASGNTWLFEGLAVSFGRQNSYRSREELVAFVRQHGVARLIDPARRDPSFDIRYGYTAWRYFTEYLRRRDPVLFRRYVDACMKDPAGWRTSFPSFDQELEAFRRELSE